MTLPNPIASTAQSDTVDSDNDAVMLRRTDGLRYEAEVSALRTKIAAGISLTSATGLPNTSITGPHIEALTETHLASTFTDGGAASGTKTMTGTVPAGAVLLGSKVIVNAGFTGDVSCVLIIGDGSDTDRYNTSTINVFATAANGVESGVPSGSKLVTTANSPVLTITSAADITPVIAAAGSVTVSIYYIKTT